MTINAGNDAWKRNPCTLLVGMQNFSATMEISIKIPQKTKNGTTIQSCFTTAGYIPKVM
jgi:hypothetical protein